MGVNRNFHWHNHSSHILALGLTQPLTELSNRDISRGVKKLACRADNLTTFMCQLSSNLEPSGPVQGLLYLYIYYNDLNIECT